MAVEMSFFGMVLAVLLVIGGTESNPGPSPQLEGKINQLLAHMKQQEEESKGVRDLLEGQKKNMQELRVSITGFDTKICGLGEMVKMLTEEQDRVKNLVKTWERKQGEYEHELRVLEGQQRRKNILIFGVEECPNEGYFDTLKIVEGVSLG
jgi:chromosome segregation ATPase